MVYRLIPSILSMMEFLSDFSMNKTDILSRDFCIVEYCMIFLKTHDSQRPVAKTLVWWVSVVPRITCGATVTWLSLRPSSLFSLAKYQQPNDITKKRSRKRKSSKKKIDHRKKYIPIKIRGSVARTIRTCVGIVSTCVKLGFIGVCYSAARQFIIHEDSWTGLDLISPKREQRDLKRENFQRVNRIRWGSGLYR